LNPIAHPTESRWLDLTLSSLHSLGYIVVPGVLPDAFLRRTREAMYRARDKIVQEVGEPRLAAAGERGVLRLMLKQDPLFFEFLEIPELLTIVDRSSGDTSILHLQNGLILPPETGPETPSLFQFRFHRDFPRLLNGYVASVNAMFAIDEFTRENGATVVVPASHQKEPPPEAEYFIEHAVPIECPAGSMIVFDSTLWHAAGQNRSGRDRLAINHQFTRSFIKQQIDYVRALGSDVVLAQKPRTQQLLGWYTRIVTSLDEYYRPEQDRLYRKGQG
jgi:ectoine hydroxylase-related dioxygenase (phytanoyl-CoA dioxygenase family)